MLNTKIFISKSHQPSHNLALEDWALQHADTSHYNYLILYVNHPSVIVGRNQNIFEEVNLNYCLKNDIEIARRISGGGTVFHDLGNLNWSFVTAFDTKKVNNYGWAARFIIELLADYKLKAYLTERNAIEVDGVKLSGQAQFTNRKRILSHGTLLVNSDLSLLQPAIEIDHAIQITSRASKSVRSTTANLSKLINRTLNVDELIDKIVSGNNAGTIDWNEVTIDRDKFEAYDWLYARSPKFVAKQFVNGEHLTIEVEKGKIKAVKSEKDHLLQDSPFLNQTYEKLLKHLND